MGSFIIIGIASWRDAKNTLESLKTITQTGNLLKLIVAILVIYITAVMGIVGFFKDGAVIAIFSGLIGFVTGKTLDSKRINKEYKKNTNM